MEIIDQTSRDMTWIENGQILQKFIIQKYFTLKNWSSAFNRLEKLYCFVTYMDILWKKMLLFMVVMTLQTLEMEKSFLCSWVDSSKLSHSKTVVFWIWSNKKELAELSWVNSFAIVIFMLFKAPFVDLNMKIFTSLSVILKN